MQETQALSLKKPNDDQGLLKLVAILTMVVDHVGVVFFPSQIIFRVIGRIAFPLFCWGIAIGVVHTKDWKRYALRILMMGIVTQPFFMLALTHSWTQLNVMATLLLGLLAVVGMRYKRYGSAIWAPLLCLSIAMVVEMDYGWRGVLLIILMYLARGTRGGLAALLVAFCLYWGGGPVLPKSFVASLTLSPLGPLNQVFYTMTNLVRLQSLAALALPLLFFRTQSGIRLPKWFTYAAYPGHLLILWLLTLILKP